MPLSCDLSRNDTIAERSAVLSETTTMHGIPNATRTKNLIRKVLWVAITLGGIGKWYIGHIILCNIFSLI